jgi:hypothetical protein
MMISGRRSRSYSRSEEERLHWKTNLIQRNGLTCGEFYILEFHYHCIPVSLICSASNLMSLIFFAGYDSVQTDSPPLSRAMEIFVSNMDKITRLKLEQKGLPFNKEYHDLYLLGAHQAYGTEAAIKQYIENSSALQFEEFPSSGASSCLGSSSNLSLSIYSSNIPPAVSDDNFGAVLHGECATPSKQLPIPFCSVTESRVGQISRQPVIEDLDLDKWDHSDLGSWGRGETTYQDEVIPGFALATSTSPSWESWPRMDYSSFTLPTTDASKFPLEDFINLDPSLSCGEDFQKQVHDEQCNTGGNNQLHDLNCLDDKVEMFSWDGSGESYFPTNSQTGENPLSELLRSELEAEEYLKSGPLESNFCKNRGLRSPAE